MSTTKNFKEKQTKVTNSNKAKAKYYCLVSPPLYRKFSLPHIPNQNQIHRNETNTNFLPFVKKYNKNRNH